MPNLGRQIEDLQCGGLKIIQDKALYTFSSDSVILANFVKIKKNEKAVEIGAGSGVISILLSKKTECKTFKAFEAQNQMAALAQENVKLNKLEDKIEIVADRIQNFSTHFEKCSFDVVFSNPPYMKTTEEGDSVRHLSRHDQLLKIDELCKVASKLLKNKGRFYCVYCAERSCELIFNLIANKLQPKTMFFTENGKGKVVLVVVEAVKGGAAGVKVLPNLVTNDEKGDYLEKLHTRNFID